MCKKGLRPVEVLINGDRKKGYFHRFVYTQSGSYSETRVLVELADGRLRFIDPFFVQFTDRTAQSSDDGKSKDLESDR